MTCDIHVLVYCPKFCIFIPNLQLVLHINIFWLHIDPISYIWCIHVSYHLKSNNFYSIHIFKIVNFRTKIMFKSKCDVNMNFTHFNSYYFVNNQYEDPFQFWQGIVHIWYQKGYCLKKDCPQAYFGCNATYFNK